MDDMGAQNFFSNIRTNPNNKSALSSIAKSYDDEEESKTPCEVHVMRPDLYSSATPEERRDQGMKFIQAITTNTVNDSMIV